MSVLSHDVTHGLAARLHNVYGPIYDLLHIEHWQQDYNCKDSKFEYRDLEQYVGFL